MRLVAIFCLITGSVLSVCGYSVAQSAADSIKLFKGEEKLKVIARAYTEEADLNYYREAMQLAKQINYDGPLLAYLMVYRAAFEVNDGSDSALFFLNKVKDSKYFDTDNQLKLHFNRQQGLYLVYQGQEQSALPYFLQNDKLSKEIKNPELEVQSIGDIAIPHYYAENYETAIEYWQKAGYLNRKLAFGDYGFGYFVNVALCFTMIEKLDSAAFYYNECLKIAEEFPKKIGLSGLGSLYLNMGVLESKRMNYIQSIEYYKKSADVGLETADEDLLMRSHSNIASMYNHLKRPLDGIDYLKTALQSPKVRGDFSLLQTTYYSLSKSYSLMSDFSKAFYYLDSAYIYRDSSLNIKKLALIGEFQEKYKSAEKEVLLKEAEAETAKQKLAREEEQAAAEKQRTITIALVIGLGLMLVLVLTILRGYKNKQRTANILRRNAKIIETKNKDITDSIQYAKNLQESILPKTNLIANSLPKYMLFFRPRDIVSGDFYWFHESSSHIYLAAADCTGHGVPGAFVSIMCYNLLNSAVRDKKFVKPGEILTEVNRTIHTEFQNDYSQFQSNDGMDITLVCLDKHTNTLYFAGAMNDLLHIRRNQPQLHKASRQAIGGSTNPDFVFETHTIQVQKDDIFYLFTDGFQDQFGGPKSKKFMRGKFINFLNNIKEFKPELQNELLEEELNSWRNHHEQVDDILIIGFQLS